VQHSSDLIPIFVSSGKSTIALSLSKALSVPFIDGDSLHPKSNVEKMSKGNPLTDADRLPWLALIRSTAERVCREEWVRARRNYAGVDATGGEADVPGSASIAEMAEYEFGEGWKWRNAGKDDAHHVRASLDRPAVIIACSALKKWYREILRGNVDAEPPKESDLVRRRRVLPDFLV
jgi:gluconokinase